MSFSVSIPLFIFTWSNERVKSVTLPDGELPKIQFSGSVKSFDITVSDYLKEHLDSIHRVYYQQLNARPIIGDAEIAIPYIVLCKEDNFKDGTEFTEVERITPGSLKYGWVFATEKLTELISNSTACLNMLPDVFNNLHIRLIHNQIVGNVNRMTLQKRYDGTGYAVQTGNKIKVKKGRQPNEMRVALHGIHFFGSQIAISE
ncbi:hypothetical protein [Ectopseudomonas oleovorans]|uniref:hypothetical protein n=1 Tax=Ectopseudomonas oleovorans TaxID=301 RepID=UPI0035AE41BD